MRHASSLSSPARRADRAPHSGIFMLRSFRASRLSCIALALLAAFCTRVVDAEAAQTPASERIVQQIVLIRHGIRSPTATPDALAVYASEPWPTWPVDPGQLTPHGAQLMQSLGRWYRQRLSDTGVAVDTCGNAATVKLIADSTPRNRDCRRRARTPISRSQPTSPIHCSAAAVTTTPMRRSPSRRPCRRWPTCSRCCWAVTTRTA
jgi:hypothetical protein